jgi:hypothetical protein
VSGLRASGGLWQRAIWHSFHRKDAAGPRWISPSVIGRALQAVRILSAFGRHPQKPAISGKTGKMRQRLGCDFLQFRKN